LSLQLHLPGIDSTVQVFRHLNVLADVFEGGAFRQDLIDDKPNRRGSKHACRDSKGCDYADHPDSEPAKWLNPCETEEEIECFHLSLAFLTSIPGTGNRTAKLQRVSKKI
jgi:hypothetical protein